MVIIMKSLKKKKRNKRKIINNNSILYTVFCEIKGCRLLHTFISQNMPKYVQYFMYNQNNKMINTTHNFLNDTVFNVFQKL